jgi:hypothetical protein
MEGAKPCTSDGLSDVIGLKAARWAGDFHFGSPSNQHVSIPETCGSGAGSATHLADCRPRRLCRTVDEVERKIASLRN